MLMDSTKSEIPTTQCLQANLCIKVGLRWVDSTWEVGTIMVQWEDMVMDLKAEINTMEATCQKHTINNTVTQAPWCQLTAWSKLLTLLQEGLIWSNLLALTNRWWLQVLWWLHWLSILLKHSKMELSLTVNRQWTSSTEMVNLMYKRKSCRSVIS